MLGEDAWGTGHRLRFRDERADASFAATLATAPRIIGASFPAPRGPADQALAVHMLPMAQDSPRLSGLDGFLLLAASGANKAMLNADLLRLMFDLTPAEAKLARRLVDGDTLNQAAVAQGISYGTARVHLRAVFVKTGVTSQGALLALLGRFSA
jgi:DNA-binding CsgD family transcriptional regulator